MGIWVGSDEISVGTLGFDGDCITGSGVGWGDGLDVGYFVVVWDGVLVAGTSECSVV